MTPTGRVDAAARFTQPSPDQLSYKTRSSLTSNDLLGVSLGK
jgi:hypothetical protein